MSKHSRIGELPARPVPRFALRPHEAADSFGVSLGTFLGWVQTGKMPRPVKVGRIALYDTESVRKAWEDLKLELTAEDSPNPWDER